MSNSNSNQSISRLGVVMVSLAIASLAACTPTQQASNTSSREQSSSSNGPDTQLASTPSQSSAPSAAGAQGANAASQFTAILGTKADGWLPKILAGKGLKNGLSPAETGKIIPGAERVSDYGFSKVTVSTVPGLKQYEFYYSKNAGSSYRLESVRLTFDPEMNQAYPDLVKVASNKYGPAKPEQVKQQMITWVGPEFVTAQITKQVTDFGSYELNVSFEKD